jgi:hypothetical protein
MRPNRVLSLAAAAALVAAPAVTVTNPALAANAPAGAAGLPVPCADLRGASVPADRIGLPTTGARVSSAEVVAATATQPEYCRVLGAIHPVDPAAPAIQFQVNLPAAWNGRTMLFGGGGYNGTIARGDGQVPAGSPTVPTPLAAGYATYGSDSGHQAGPAGSRDGSFGRNDEALRNFGGDALKKTNDVAQALVKQRYGAGPTFRYVAGGSTGGREALLAVSRWPGDYEGAIVLYPAWDAISLDLKFGEMTRQLAKPGAYPTQQDRQLLLDAVLATCDGLDGLSDGIVSNQKRCDQVFDPTKARVGQTRLRCPAGKDRGPGCLSDAKIESFEVINAPLDYGYRLASGERSYPGFTTWGTDFGVKAATPVAAVVTDLALGTKQPVSPMPVVGPAGTNPPYGSTFWDEFVRHLVTRDPAFDALWLDPAAPGRWQRRIQEVSAIGEVTSDNIANLGAFAARGGKILMAHGVHDALVSNRASQAFVGRVTDRLGAATTAGFLRYYEIPGYGHAVSNRFTAQWDSLAALTAWVENVTPPGPQVVGDRIGTGALRTRPLCAWPSWPRYVGGDPTTAASFQCAAS